MRKTLDIIDKQLELGDVKTITDSRGIVKFIELLFSSTTKAQFALSTDQKTIEILVSDNNLSMPQLYCKMGKGTLRNLILSLKNIHNQLLDEGGQYIMKLTHGINIDENIITAKIAVSELGDSTRDAATELNQLHNFVRTIEYKSIDFSGNLKLVNNMPVVTEDETDGVDIENVTIPDLINKKYVLDESLAIEFSMDITKIPEAEYSSNVVFNSPELLGQARATLFIEKIKATIAEKLAELRALANDIEKEVDVVL